VCGESARQEAWAGVGVTLVESLWGIAVCVTAVRRKRGSARARSRARVSQLSAGAISRLFPWFAANSNGKNEEKRAKRSLRRPLRQLVGATLDDPLDPGMARD